MGQIEVPALREITLEVPKGELVVFLGPSGSGKTTLLNIIGGLDSPTSGRVVIGGVDITDYNEAQLTRSRRTQTGFVFQFFNLVPTLTALENVQLVAELTGPDGRKRSVEVLERVGLGDRLDHFPGQLSGGEQQRVSIARGLVKDPDLVLADEPTGSLDVETGTGILRLLRQTVEDGRRTVITVTHNSQIARVAHRVIELRDGQVVGVTANPNPADPDDLKW
jgi:putative ABC transport system ATP-binding protein